MQKKLSIFLCSALFSLAATSLPSFKQPGSQEEALFIRRIVDFWNEGDLLLTKNHIEEFLLENPDNSYIEELHLLLGEIALKNGSFKEALEEYESLESPDLIEHILLHRLECLIETKNYSEILSLSEKHAKTFVETDLEKHESKQFFEAIALFELGKTSTEHAEKYLEKAEKELSALIGSSKEQQVIKPLSELYSFSKKPDKAVKLFLEMSEKFPEKKEDLLYEAALAQMNFEPQTAIETFSQIHHLNGKRKSAAAYNKMLLLFDQKKYEEMLLAKDTLFSTLAKPHQEILRFFIGKSYFYVGDHKRSIDYLTQFLETNSSIEEEKEHAYLTILTCAKEIKDLPLYTKNLEKFAQDLPLAKGLEKAYLLRARLHKSLKKTLLAKKDYLTILETSKCPQTREKALFECSYLFYEMENWADARNLARLFLEQSQKEKMLSKAWKVFANSAIFQTEKGDYAKDLLIKDLEKVLEHASLFKKEDELQYLYQLATAYFDTKNYQKCIESLTKILTEKVSSLSEGSIYLLLAKAYLNGFENDPLYVKYAEKALTFNLASSAEKELEIGLFNSYLKDFEKSHQPIFLEKAREKLFSAFCKGAPLQKNNLFWLINEYSSLAKSAWENHWSDVGEKERLLALKAKKVLDSLQETDLSPSEILEKRIQKADIYGYLDLHKRKKELLEAWIEKSPSMELWSRLADTYLELNEVKKALFAYEKAEKCPKASSFEKSSLWVSKAKALLKHPDKNIPREEILSQLKTIYLQKNLLQEPLHLEAALLYTDFFVMGLKGKKRAEKKIELLQKIAEEFLSDDDVLSQEYQLNRAKFPEKDSVFLAYMDLFELEIFVSQLTICQLDKPQDLEHVRNLSEVLWNELIYLCPSKFFQERMHSLKDSFSNDSKVDFK